MNIVYQGGQVIDVEISHALAQSRITQAERVAIFGCDQPNIDIWQTARDLENGEGLLTDLVDTMVVKGVITSERAQEIAGA